MIGCSRVDDDSGVVVDASIARSARLCVAGRRGGLPTSTASVDDQTGGKVVTHLILVVVIA